MKKRISMILILVLVLGFAFQAMGLASVPVKGIKLNVSTLTLDTGKIFIIKVAFIPSNTTQKVIKYTTSDSNVVTVDSKGKVLAKKAGKATITVTSESNKKIVSKCVVTVRQAISSYINENGLPIAKKPIKISMVTVRQSNGGTADKLWYFKWARERANINFNVTQIEASAWQQTKNLLFASGDLPHLFLNSGFGTNDILRFGMIEKQLIDLTPYVEKYGVNIKKVFSENKEAKAASITPDGKMYTLPSIINVKPDYSSTRAWINQKWLSNLGMKIPNTTDELYNALKAFKEKDPNMNGKADEIPFGGSWNEGYAENDILLSAFGMPVKQGNNKAPVSGGIYIKNGKVALHVLQPEYKEYLIYMNKLWSEGLIDKDIFTQTQVQANAKSSQNLIGCTTDSAPHIIDPLRYKDWAAVIPLTSKVNSQKVWPSNPSISIGSFQITKIAKYPEALLRLVDMYFTEKGSLDFWYGPMKGSPELVGYEGWYLKDSTIVFNYDDKGNNLWNYMNAYMNPLNGMKPGLHADNSYIPTVYGTEPVKLDDVSGYWRSEMDKNVLPYIVKEKMPGVLYLDSKNLARTNELSTALNDYVAQMTAKFIFGNETISNYNKFITQVKELGAEEYESIYQNAYDNYSKNLK